MATLTTLSRNYPEKSVITDQQMRRLMKLLSEGKTLVQAAVRAAMSEPTARKYARSGQFPSEMTAPHKWRTRSDPFEEVWPEIEELLNHDIGLQAKTIFAELERRYPGRFAPGQLRTLQRRVHAWKARFGPVKEVCFEQEHKPGEQAQSDFTDMRELEVTIAGEPFDHLLYHFVLKFSNWEAAMTCPSESFESLNTGLQGSLWRLGGVPGEHQTDNLSAATHELHDSHGRDFNKRYLNLLAHYDLDPSRNHPGVAKQNGNVESANGHLKNAIDQQLKLRHSRDFESLEAYQAFIQDCVASRNATRTELLAQERPFLKPLPSQPLPVYTELFAKVSRYSVIRVGKRRYSVPSRLIGRRLTVHLYADVLELYYQGVQVEVLPRLLGDEMAYIDYRHIIHSLVRKPRGFRNYVFREGLYPRLVFRQTYDALVAHDDSKADLEYLRILHMAAADGEEPVANALEALRTEGVVPEYETVRERVRGPRTPTGVPDVQIELPDLSVYDRLLDSCDASQDGEMSS
jgi:hypothetical protein